MNLKKNPPEGGWGYMVGLSVVISQVVIVGPSISFGLLYGEFFQKNVGSTTSMVFVQSACYMCYSVSGLFVNSLFKRFSCRQVGLAGAAIYCSGTFLTIFVQSFGYMVFSYSILQGLGFGLMVPATYTAFNQYFVERRYKILMILKPFITFGLIFTPVLLNAILEKYLFRGTLAILAAISLHIFVASILLQPVEWHMKESCNDIEMKPVKRKSAKTAVVEQSRNDEDIKEQTELLLTDLTYSEANTVTLQSNQEPINQISSRNNDKNAYKKRNTIMNAIVEFFDLSLLTDGKYLNLLIGVAASEFSEVTFIIMLPMYLVSIGWDKADAAISISTLSIAGLVAKIVLAVTSPWVNVKSRYIYLIAVVMTIIGRLEVSIFCCLAFLFVNQFYPVIAVISILGFFRAWMMVTIPLIFADYAPVKRFPAAFGMYMFTQGLVLVLFAPFVGYLRDVTNNYHTSFYALMVALLVCVVPWMVEIFFCRGKLENIEHPRQTTLQ